jgi:hypothetical protein
MQFGQVRESEWSLADRIGRARARVLLRTPFESICAELACSAELVRVVKDPLKKYPGASRAIVSIQVLPRLVDLFHNGAGGYRAQYYLGLSEGALANRFAIDSLLPAIWAQFDKRDSQIPKSLIENSLTHDDAKIWIHQGIWFRQMKLVDRNLHVERWRRNGEINELRQKRIPTWAALTPANEVRIEIKGGSVNQRLLPLPFELKPHRANEIGSLGYT